MPERRTLRSIRVEADPSLDGRGSQREIRDIERVSALLRRLQPNLVIRREDVALEDTPPSGPPWLVIGGVWVSTLILIGIGAAGMAIILR
jgi:hypothetical protein